MNDLSSDVLMIPSVFLFVCNRTSQRPGLPFALSLSVTHTHSLSLKHIYPFSSFFCVAFFPSVVYLIFYVFPPSNFPSLSFFFIYFLGLFSFFLLSPFSLPSVFSLLIFKNARDRTRIRYSETQRYIKR